MKLKTLAWMAVPVAVAAALYAAWPSIRGTAAADPASAIGAASAASAARPAQTVGVMVAQLRDVPVTLEAAGTVVSLNTVDLRPQVAGTVAEVAVREGQFVRAGQLLFRLDDRADRANLDKARAQLARDRASLADLERQWVRAKDLRAQNFIAQSAADSVQAQLDAQRAAVDADQAAVRSAEVQLSFDTIVSPLAGRAGAIAVYRGTLVQPTQTVLVTVSQIDPIGVSFTVPEAQLGPLLRLDGAAKSSPQRPGAGPSPAARKDRPASGPASASAGRGSGGGAGLASGAIQIVLPAERARGASTPEALSGRVSFVDNAVDTATGTIRVKGEVANPTQQLWPGQYVQVRMTMRTLAGAVVVPQAALIIRGNERSVYLVGADGNAELRTVQLRYAFGESAVVDGIVAGEKVVTEGKQNLRPGVPLRETAALSAQGRRGAASAASAASAPVAGLVPASGTTP
jgi:multidrug efflux pump subunit AcrA (membrane-fusion protein)